MNATAYAVFALDNPMTPFSIQGQCVVHAAPRPLVRTQIFFSIDGGAQPKVQMSTLHTSVRLRCSPLSLKLATKIEASFFGRGSAGILRLQTLPVIKSAM